MKLSKFKIGDKVIYQDACGKPLSGSITDILRDENGNPVGYAVQLDDGTVLDCDSDKLAHLDLNKL